MNIESMPSRKKTIDSLYTRMQNQQLNGKTFVKLYQSPLGLSNGSFVMMIILFTTRVYSTIVNKNVCFLGLALCPGNQLRYTFWQNQQAIMKAQLDCNLQLSYSSSISKDSILVYYFRFFSVIISFNEVTLFKTYFIYRSAISLSI